MRQRKAKDLEKRLQQCSRYMIDGLEEGVEGGYFDDDQELFLEIGCGKGDFIIKKALDNPHQNFIAIEGQETVILRALEKAMQMNLPNLKFMCTFVDHMEFLFGENQLSGIYLNFSDPWPKARHAKRRLTDRRRLADYRWALKPGGFIEIKTDNQGLYQFTLEEIQSAEYTIMEQTEDLHKSSYRSRYTTTEYEERFRAAGKNIYYVKVSV